MRRKRPSRMAFNNTSMLDVIFIILIFFVSVSKLREGVVRIRLPEAAASTGRVERDERIVVSLDPSDRLLLNGKPVAGREGLATALRGVRERGGQDRPVVFQADRTSTSGALVTALKTVSDEGFRNVAFEYEPKPGAPR